MNFFSQKKIQLTYKFKKFKSVLPPSKKSITSIYEDKNLRSSFYLDLWKNAALNLGMVFESLGYGYWRVKKNSNAEVRGNISGIELDSELSVLLAGNKALCYKLAISNVKNCPIPDFCEYDLDSLEIANIFMRRKASSCVVKPAAGTGAGSGVITGVASYDDLVESSIYASIFNKRLLIEETVPGSSYRLLFLGGKFLHAIRRDPPHVTGNGKSTIKQLINDENLKRLSSPVILSFFPITIDRECRSSLREQSLTLHDIPEKNRRVIVKNVVNQNASDQNIDVTSEVHPSIIKICSETIACMRLHLAGIDILSPDISKPLSACGGVINEVNSKPGLHHHYLTSSVKKLPLAEEILDYSLKRNFRYG